jgi:hypothetical protein
MPRYGTCLLSIVKGKRIVGIDDGTRVLGYRVRGGFLGRGKEADRCALTLPAAHYLCGWDCGLWSADERTMLGPLPPAGRPLVVRANDGQRVTFA